MDWKNLLIFAGEQPRCTEPATALPRYIKNTKRYKRNHKSESRKMDSMFDTLIELPLFRGVSHERMSEIVGMSRFHFLKYAAGSTIIKAGDACTNLLFVLSGQIRLTVRSADGSLEVAQTLTAPEVIAPDFMFGRTTTYPVCVTALEPVNIMEVSKVDYLQILNHDDIFLFNYLNYLASRAQTCFDGALPQPSVSTAEARLAWLVMALTQSGAGDITLSFSDTGALQIPACAEIINRALENLKNKGLIDYTDHKIIIKDRRRMTGLLTGQPPAAYTDTDKK